MSALCARARILERERNDLVSACARGEIVNLFQIFFQHLTYNILHIFLNDIFNIWFENLFANVFQQKWHIFCKFSRSS